jgi:septal ring factor EnvC (AmiA/AmiB activator)
VRRLFATVLLLIVAVAAHAGTSTESAAQRTQREASTRQQLERVRKQIQSLSDEQKKIEGQKSQASKDLRAADASVAGAQGQLRVTMARLSELQAQLASLEQQQAELEKKLSHQREDLAELVRSAYALGQNEELKLLLEQDRVGDLARVLAYHRYFSQDRQQRITALTTELNALAKVQEQIKAQQPPLQAAREQQQQAVAQLAQQRAQRGKLVSQLDARYRDQRTRLSALGRDEKNTAALLERLRKAMATLPPVRPVGVTPAHPVTPLVAYSGLSLPVAGAVIAGFGGTLPDGHASQGLLIAGTAGADVHAAAAGRVAYADWLKGYGLLVIVDHGGGLMTLYAYNDALLKRAGDTVAAGEAIAQLGSSGGQGRAALYFELRRNGQPQDPRGWLKK